MTTFMTCKFVFNPTSYFCVASALKNKFPFGRPSKNYFNSVLNILIINKPMEIPVSSKPYQNGISDATKGGVRWLSQEMSVPRPVVICGPSGSGKSTLLKLLMDEYPEYFGFSISHTTRKPRLGEEHGKDYNFVDRSEFENAIANGDFLEFTEFSGNIYGTSKRAVKNIQNQGLICILDIEIEGVKSIKRTDLNPRYIFVKPPTVNDLEGRLRARGSETEESLQKRLAKAQEELAYGEAPGNFDVVLINDKAEDTYKQLKNFLLRDIEDVRKRNQV